MVWCAWVIEQAINLVWKINYFQTRLLRVERKCSLTHDVSESSQVSLAVRMTQQALHCLFLRV